jgi:glycosyltransferase involved in cell wall biosynthesis
MRIGVAPILDPRFGGIYQYSQTMLDVITRQVMPKTGDSYVLFVNDPTSAQAGRWRSSGWEVQPLFPPFGKHRLQVAVKQSTGVDFYNKAWRLIQQVTHGAGIDRVRYLPEVSRWLRKFQIDLMIYPAPDELAFEVDIPYVMAIHDLQHRLQPHFPEMSARGNLYRREYLFRNAARYATLLISESEVGKQDILSFYGTYGITAERIKVLPFLPSLPVTGEVSYAEKQRIRIAYHLPDRYLFYPAQFWAHKNHARIVQALHLLDRQHQLKIPIVFAGAHTGRQMRNYEQLLALIREHGMTGQVLFPGYVPDQDMPGLYAGSVALLMPTFFGPSNIPVLEAWAYRCPVITSDIHGIREQCAQAALLVDPSSVEAIANGVYRLWTDKELCSQLAVKGVERLSTYTRNDYTGRLYDILEDAKQRAVQGRNEGVEKI